MIEPEDITRYHRELRAMLRKAADDPAAFAQVLRVLNLAAEQMQYSAAELIANGYTYADIAREIGVSRQAIRQRFGSVRS